MKRYSTLSPLSLVIILFSLFTLFPGNKTNAQLTYRVLFLGNSYTGVNNLPQLIRDVALSAGDTLVFDSYTPGGYQLEDHTLDVNSKNKIMAGGWHYVVIQGQSQEPIIYNNQFTTGGHALSKLIKQYNPCAVTMPYMTWGRKNGDASTCGNFPITCTYQGMDTTIRYHYLNLTSFINGEISPVSILWNYLRQNNPGIDLYQADDSHPSGAGSYAAACCFYATIFKKDPTLITYDFGLSSTDAAIIRTAAKTKVFANLQMWNYKKLPRSNFSYQVGSGVNTVLFNPISMGVKQNYFWDFGDGVTTTTLNPTHSYTANGTYTVSLTATNCDLQGVHTSFTDTVIQFCSHTPTIAATHTWLCNYDTLWTQPSGTYQWFCNGVPLPETNRYLANYARYNIYGFSVLSTQGGCSELSQVFTKTAQWSGYYFDAIGNPCAGKPVPFAVLSSNGLLSGSEKILWFKNKIPLPQMTGEDTLFMSGSGKYECKVVNPNSACPYDTTSYLLTIDCGDVGIGENAHGVLASVFPNPAWETISIKFQDYSMHVAIEIYSAMGRLERTIITSSATTTINITDLPPGIYFVRLKNDKHGGLKFFKPE
jgi:PKD repeat protein